MSTLPTRPLYIISATCLLAILYFGRDVLQSLALAAILSAAVAPLTRRFARLGLSRAPATLVTVILAALVLAGLGAVMVGQFASLTDDLPAYRKELRAKTKQLQRLAERPLATLEARLQVVDVPGALYAAPATAPAPAGVAAAPPRPSVQDSAGRLLSQISGPLGKAGIVLVLFIFISLEHESLQDRLIRLAGDTAISRTMQTLADAAQGISRFFFAQIIVNAAFGLAVAATLWLLGLPHAFLWGMLSGVLRFVPYLGMLIAGSLIALFAAAVDPGWTLALTCMALFLVMEVGVAYLVEPRVYGHSSGLSPLAVIVAALVWGTLWGPVGLILSTPLTLCLVVAGRHVEALAPLTTLLGAAPSVGAAQRFYQRALAGDIAAIVRDGQARLKRGSLAAYCDKVLIPGMAMAVPEIESGKVGDGQLDQLRKTIVEVTEEISAPSADGPCKRKRVPLMDKNIGSHLRKLRQARTGQWQGSLDVPARSVVLCAGLGSDREDFLSELLVRALVEGGTDARSGVLNRPEDNPGDDKAQLVSTVILPYPEEANVDAWLNAVADLRTGMPHACIVVLKLQLDGRIARQPEVEKAADLVVQSFEQARAFVESGA
ncbi:AI-2E family transporter [Duganella sp. FT92W]|uniref:AI-2E family transporter n=1 Tax=Pseudoduganella rivuli TaxID=2666085 RepID=A0A7X2LTK0_9BURK|nr:AI-2E family transporter [Pseudoduganella rivuli]MRV72062.1 AI-2E family transporter [Pseudoduganella rivuli]